MGGGSGVAPNWSPLYASVSVTRSNADLFGKRRRAPKMKRARKRGPETFIERFVPCGRRSFSSPDLRLLSFVGHFNALERKRKKITYLRHWCKNVRLTSAAVAKETAVSRGDSLRGRRNSPRTSRWRSEATLRQAIRRGARRSHGARAGRVPRQPKGLPSWALLVSFFRP